MLEQTSIEVHNSLTDCKWVFSETDNHEVERIMRLHKLPEFVARLLASRGVEAKDVPSFLCPSLKSDFPDPHKMTDMHAMSIFIADAVRDGRRIAVFGDFDVDGATSTAVLLRFFKHIGHDVPFYIPDRLSEGYGPNAKALKTLKDKGAEIVFLVDCGTTSHDVVAEGRKLELDIIILDHHEAEETLPDANFVINPKRTDDASALDMLAAVGVAFLACVSINTALREKGYYADNDIKEPSLKDMLDLVALGTVCDMVPLTGPNRLFVRKGFELMKQTQNPGLKALMEVGNVTSDPKPYHAGFVFGPRINAGSRVHQSDLGARLLITEVYDDALNLAWTLDDCNKKRKSIQSEMLTRARNQVMARELNQFSIIVVDDPNGHSGMAGLVAGQLSKEFGKPACVITYVEQEDGTREGRGSGRSIKGVNIADAFIDARHADVLIKGGGHAMAGGFTISPDKIDDFYTFMREHVDKQLKGEVPVIERQIDGLITVKGVHANFIKLIENNAGPFGQGNPEPVFVLPKVRVERPDIVGKNHVRCLLVDWEGGSRLKAVAFQSSETSLGQALLKNDGEAFHIAGQFKVDSWNGQERAEMHIIDAVRVDQTQQTQGVDNFEPERAKN